MVRCFAMHKDMFKKVITFKRISMCRGSADRSALANIQEQIHIHEG